MGSRAGVSAVGTTMGSSPFVRLGFVALAAICAIARGAGPDLKQYDTPYYILYTDVDRPDAMEAAIRMTHVAEEYIERTRGYAGQFHERLPFYLYTNSEDYTAAGGPAKSSGVFIMDGKASKLMAVAGPHTSGGTWHVVQHEAFHQFAAAMINGELPEWVNEGMAEYCGEGLFTGDNFLLGAVPQFRLARVQKSIADGKTFRSLKEMMLLSHKQWNEEIKIANYDQAWSMIHYLLNGEGGKFVAPFNKFMLQVSRSVPWQKAWTENFGNDIDGFEAHWREYWTTLPDHPTGDVYAVATMATVVSFFGRAQMLRQPYNSVDAMLAGAESEEMAKPLEKLGPADWLPASLLKDAAVRAKRMGSWSIETVSGRNPRLVCILSDGRKMVGTYIINNGHVQVTVNVPPAPAPKRP